jgi:hypothetical protein
VIGMPEPTAVALISIAWSVTASTSFVAPRGWVSICGLVRLTVSGHDGSACSSRRNSPKQVG